MYTDHDSDGEKTFFADCSSSAIQVIAITKELTATLRKNRTIDWQKKDSARARMRMMIKKLLKQHKYPPEGMEDAVQTVMLQCELWADNTEMSTV